MNHLLGLKANKMKLFKIISQQNKNRKINILKTKLTILSTRAISLSYCVNYFLTVIVQLFKSKCYETRFMDHHPLITSSVTIFLVLDPPLSYVIPPVCLRLWIYAKKRSETYNILLRSLHQYK